MSVEIRYMGTKRAIAPSVADIISRGPKGPLLDLFSGVCAIGSSVAPSRQVWSNDAQCFSTLVARALFASDSLPPNSDEIALTIRPLYKRNLEALESKVGRSVELEKRALQDSSVTLLQALENKIPHVGSSKKLESQRREKAEACSTFPYSLFTITYAGGYFGVQQAIQIDSIRYGIDELFRADLINRAEYDWLLLALCQALSKVANTTGHFAQYLSVKSNSANRFVSQRVRSVWQEWLKAIYVLAPYGSKKWRAKNKVFQRDANVLLGDLSNEEDVPSIIYADPPYTDDQYSRYYHVYETLILYDYPESSGKGRYRSGRFASHFSLKTKVSSAMEALVGKCASIGSALVLSYPEKGLVENATDHITSLIFEHFGEFPEITKFDHSHSTMGASKGVERHAVKELVFSVGI